MDTPADRTCVALRRLLREERFHPGESLGSERALAERLGVGRTVWQTRQIVAHGHVLINGRKCDIASAFVKPGDVITFKEGIHKVVRDNMEQVVGHNVPGWLEWNPGQLTAKVNALPTQEDVPFEVNLNLIIEFYR